MNKIKIIGIGLVVLGLILLPIGVGILMLVVGMLILVFDFYRGWWVTLVPEKYRKKIKEEVEKSYEPYQPAIKGMKSIGIEILKTSLIIFLIITIFLLIRFGFGGNEDNWICQEGEWVKHGNPSAAMPNKPCD